MSKSKHGKSGGVELTDALIGRLAADAERGYDPGRLRAGPRRGRPPIGSEAAGIFQVRLDPELRDALARAASGGRLSPSELTRRALRTYLKVQRASGEGKTHTQRSSAAKTEHTDLLLPTEDHSTRTAPGRSSGNAPPHHPDRSRLKTNSVSGTEDLAKTQQ